MKTIQQIVDDADKLVPNVVPVQDKVAQINNIERDFYANVKVPDVHYFNFTKGQSTYNLTGTDLKSKDIEVIQTSVLNYRQDKNTGTFNTNNKFTFNDNTKELKLSPAPTFSGEGRVMYYKNSTSNYTMSDLNTVINIPEEFQQTIIYALCAWVALTQDDISKATVHETKYRSDWNAASQNYAGG